MKERQIENKRLESLCPMGEVLLSLHLCSNPDFPLALIKTGQFDRQSHNKRSYGNYSGHFVFHRPIDPLVMLCRLDSVFCIATIYPTGLSDYMASLSD